MRLHSTRVLPIVALLVVVLAVSAVAVPTAVATENTPAQATVECDETTSTEVIGCWNGTTYNETFAFNQSEGLNQTELQLVADRAMARVEYLRDRPFTDDVPVNLITREEYQERFEDGDTDTEDEFNRWNDQVWKALFIVGEDESSAEAIDTVFGGAVAGFYSPADDEITLVTDEAAETTQIDETTLVHEFGHAMQDQYHDLADSRFTGDTQDADLAIDGIVEGEVVYIEDQFENRCLEEWDCLEDPPADDDEGPDEEPNLGILQLVLQPYFDGPVYAESLFEDGGWEAVEELMDEPPQTTREIIHREPFTPPSLDVEDTATDGWERFEEQGVDGADTVGEASIYIMLWYQAFAFDASTMPVQDHLEAPESYYDRFNYETAYNYAYSASEGWANDKLYPHRNVETGEDGYIWVTEWESEADASQFESAHTQIVAAHGEATTPVTVIDEGPFRGAYAVLRDGTTVTIVHGPDEESIEALRPGITEAIEETEDEDPQEEPTDDDPADADEEDPQPAEPVPGFGVAVAAISLVVAVWLRRRDG